MSRNTHAGAAGPDLYFGRLVTPRIGAVFAGQGGLLAGIIKGEKDQPDYCLIVPQTPFDIKGRWGPEVRVAGAEDDLDGMACTQALSAAGSTIAKSALAIDHDGHRDWYIASRREGRVCAANLQGAIKGYCWTSTQCAAWAYTAWAQDFGDGGQGHWGKHGEFPALVVRRIPIR